MENKINNIIKIPTSTDDFYKYWMLFLRPFHNLTNKEIDVAAKLLLYRNELCKVVKDDEILNRLLLSKETRVRLINDLGITMPHFHVLLSALKRIGFIKEGAINPRFIPRVNSDKQFNLLMSFDFE